MKKIELTKKDIEGFKLNIAEMEERCSELNSSIKILYLWIERMELKYKNKFKIIKIDEFSK